MKRADLYIRVSTDEQADKGYSQRDQEERLKGTVRPIRLLLDRLSTKTIPPKPLTDPNGQDY